MEGVLQLQHSRVDVGYYVITLFVATRIESWLLGWIGDLLRSSLWCCAAAGVVIPQLATAS
jgi:hypothetical protein